jgi:hypothetical protein
MGSAAALARCDEVYRAVVVPDSVDLTATNPGAAVAMDGSDAWPLLVAARRMKPPIGPTDVSIAGGRGVRSLGKEVEGSLEMPRWSGVEVGIMAIACRRLGVFGGRAPLCSAQK